MKSLVRRASFRFRPMRPYSFELTVKKPAGWSWFTPYEVWDKGTIWSGFWYGDLPVGVKSWMSGEKVAVELYCGRKLKAEEISRLKLTMAKVLGVDEDIIPFYRLICRNRILKALVRHLYGMREGWGMNIFSSLTLAVLLQMAPIKRSEEMWDCLIKNYGKKIAFDKKRVTSGPAKGPSRVSIRRHLQKDAGWDTGQNSL